MSERQHKLDQTYVVPRHMHLVRIAQCGRTGGHLANRTCSASSASSQGRHTGKACTPSLQGVLKVWRATEGATASTQASVPLPWCTSKSRIATRRTPAAHPVDFHFVGWVVGGPRMQINSCCTPPGSSTMQLHNIPPVPTMLAMYCSLKTVPVSQLRFSSRT